MAVWRFSAACLAAISTVAGCNATEPTAQQKPPTTLASGSVTQPAPPAPTARRGASERPPPGFVKVRVAGITPAAQGNAVLLVDDAQRRALVVFIGDTEALSIQLRLGGTKYKRPLTHDLIDHMLKHLGARVHSVRVDKLQDDIFYGVVVLQDGDRIKEFDARTSDGVALALGHNAPVYVAADVLERAGIALDMDGRPEAEPRLDPPGRQPIAL